MCGEWRMVRKEGLCGLGWGGCARHRGSMLLQFVRPCRHWRASCMQGWPGQRASQPRSSRSRRATKLSSTSTAAHQSGRRPRGRQCQWRPGQPPAASPLRMGEGRSRGRVASQSPPSGQCQGAAVGRSDAKGGRPGAAQQEEWPCLGQGLPLHIPQGPNRCTNLLSPVERMEVALSARSRRLRPASASSVPSQAPSCSLRSRVCTLPRKLTTCRQMETRLNFVLNSMVSCNKSACCRGS